MKRETTTNMFDEMVPWTELSRADSIGELLMELEHRDDGEVDRDEVASMATSASNQEHVYTLSDEGPMEAFGCAFRTINRTPELENEVEERAAPAPLMQGLLRQLSSFSLDGIDVSKESDLDIPSGFDFEAFVNTPEQAAQGMLEQATPQVPSAPAVEATPCQTNEQSAYVSPHLSPVLQSANHRVVIQTPHGPALLLADQMNLPQPPTVARSTTQLPSIKQKRLKFQRWSEEEDEILRQAVELEGGTSHNWTKISRKYFANERTPLQCKSRWTKALRPGLVLGDWQPHEDHLIRDYRAAGMKWSEIAELLPGRIGEHVRDRYVNFLDPSLNKSPWTKEEDAILYQQQQVLGNRWAAIARLLPGRSENAVKNRWHNAKMTQRRKLRKHVSEKARQAQSQRARQHAITLNYREPSLEAESEFTAV